MALSLLRRLWNNLGTLLLAFSLALAVWISAVLDDDPNEECTSPRSLPIEIIGQDEDLLLIGSSPGQVSLRLRAPSSVCRRLAGESRAVQVYADISQLGSGEHVIPVDIKISLSPVQIIEYSPQEIELSLETLATRELSIRPIRKGEPAPGFYTDILSLTASRVTISGPQSLVELVDDVQAEIDINGARETVTQVANLKPLDENGQVVSGLTMSPESVTLSQAILQSGGYRDVAVKVETTGQPATGYRVTNISVSPPTVTIFSSDPQLVEELPGFLRTQPIDLTDTNDDLETRLALDLPEDVSVVGEQSVLVLVGIAAIETSTPVSIPVEVTGLAPGLEVVISPENVDVILSGPLIVLDELSEEDVRFFVDLTDLDVGTHLIEPTIEILPERVQVESFTPETIEVILSLPVTPSTTPTSTPTLTPAPTSTSTPLPQATATDSP